MLNTNKALELAQLLHPFIPEKINENDNVLEFVGKIIRSIKNSETPENFGMVVMLLGGLTIDEMKNIEGSDSIRIFVDGLAENNIISLIEFYRWLT